MAIIFLTLAIIGIAALAPRYGTDSRNLVHGPSDSFLLLPDHHDAWTSPQTR